jgi:hypothetical protein
LPSCRTRSNSAVRVRRRVLGNERSLGTADKRSVCDRTQMLDG